MINTHRFIQFAYGDRIRKKMVADLPGNTPWQTEELVQKRLAHRKGLADQLREGRKLVQSSRRFLEGEGWPRHWKLSARLDRLINFASALPAPTVDSWNPFKRARQHKALQQWVDERPPSAGITGPQLEKQYPGHPSRERHIVGGLIGGAVGAGGGALLAAKLHNPHYIRPLVTGGAAVGGLAGTFAGDPKHYIQTVKGHIADKRLIEGRFETDPVYAHTVKTGGIPVATTHGQVAGELKKQGIGFFKRHAAALGTYGARHDSNAAFLGLGPKGVIVSPERVPAAVIRHEAGHAKDYAHYGGHKGWQKAYPTYGAPSLGIAPYVHNTLLPEHRAWKHAGKLNKRDQELKDAALRTYARGNWLLSTNPNERLIRLAAGLKKDIRFEFKHVAGNPDKPGAVYTDESNALYTPWKHVQAKLKEKGQDASALWKGNRKGNMVRIVNANGSSSLHYSPEGKSRIPGEPDWEQRKRISRRAAIGVGAGLGVGAAAGGLIGHAIGRSR